MAGVTWSCKNCGHAIIRKKAILNGKLYWDHAPFIRAGIALSHGVSCECGRAE